MQRIKETLREWGLSEKEVKVYIATLMLGQARANDIAEKTKLLRETTYAVLKSLKEKGLISHVIRGGVKEYSAASPKKLVEVLERKKKKVENILGELEDLQSSSLKRTIVEFYEGSEGIRTASNDIVEKGNKTVRGYVNTSVLKVMPFYSQQFRRKRREKNVQMRVFCNESREIQELIKNNRKELRQVKFSKDVTDLHSGFYIYDNKVLFLKASQKEQLGVIIEDEELVELQRRIFDRLWNH